MNKILLIIIVILLLVLVLMFAVNMFREQRQLNRIRRQFGHADDDALLGGQVRSVRDGKDFSHEKTAARPPKLKPSLAGKNQKPEMMAADIEDGVLTDSPATAADVAEIATFAPLEDTPPPREPELVSPPEPAPKAPEGGFVGEIKTAFARMLGGSEPPLTAGGSVAEELVPEEETAERRTPLQAAAPREPLVALSDLRQTPLPWFDGRADYMAYVSLREPSELPALPRFSNRHRYQIVGCTMDDRFQPAEPVPGVLYQAFAVGLQAISRKGLAEVRDLDAFGRQVAAFAESMDAEVYLDDAEAFLAQAAPLDELCARVDQTIAIHLVSRISILGIELRSALEDLGFQLMEEGAFGFAGRNGELKYSAVTLDGSRFTSSLLASQPYKGFSMLFDITRVPPGEGNFDEFMNLASRLSAVLNLELVDDQIQKLSTDWLKEVRTYVLGIQQEMLDAGIEPGDALAQRLFA